MAQTVKLKRSAVAGNVPSTSNLELGELAINTNDGKIYFEKNDGSPSIETILTTDSQTTGSIEVTGNISGSATSTGSFGSLVVTDAVQGNLTVEGDIIANQYIVSSSVTHLTASAMSGSTQFGDDSADTHQFTGSLKVTGSLNVETGRILEQGSSVIDHATAMSIVFGG